MQKSGNGRTILLVEDEIIIAKMSTRILEKYGYTVIHADNGEDARKAVENNPEISLILMDIDLGSGMDGTEAAEIILEKHDLPLVFLSSHIEPEVVEKTEGITSYGYIVKNSGETVLYASIKMAYRLFEAKKNEEAKEEKLRESEKHYRTLYENTGSGIIVIEEDMTISLANNTFVESLGYCKEDIENKKKWTEMVYEEDLPFMLEQHKLRRSNPEMAKSTYEFRFIGKNGKLRDTLLYISLIPGTKKSIASLIDITERKEAEENIRKSEIKYKRIFENVQDVYYQVDINGRIAEISPSIEGYGEYTRDELIGMPITDVYYDPSERDTFIKTLMSQGKVNDYEIRLRTKDNREVIGSVMSRIYYDDEGKTAGIEGSIRNITERKRSENKLKSLLNEKELLVKEIIHRVKNDLNVIYSLLELQGEEKGASGCRHVLKDAASRVKSMASLYNRLYHSEKYNELNIKQYIGTLVEQITGIYSSTNSVKTSLQVEDFELPLTVLSPLGIIINELLSNSLRFAFSGRNDGLIEISAVKTGRTVDMVFRDNGLGLPDNICLEKSGGFGMKLVLMLIKQLKGTIETIRTGGTTYKIRFESD